MKKSGKNMMKLAIVILIVIIIVLVGIIVNISNTNNPINKQEEAGAEQLTTTSTDNAYVDLATHMTELASASNGGKLQVIKATKGTFTVPTSGYYAGIIMAFSNNYADNGSTYGSATIGITRSVSNNSGTTGNDSEATGKELTFTQTGNQRRGYGYVTAVYKLNAGDTIKFSSSLQQGILRIVVALPDEDVTINGDGTMLYPGTVDGGNSNDV